MFRGEDISLHLDDRNQALYNATVHILTFYSPVGNVPTCFIS